MITILVPIDHAIKCLSTLCNRVIQMLVQNFFTISKVRIRVVGAYDHHLQYEPSKNKDPNLESSIQDSKK